MPSTHNKVNGELHTHLASRWATEAPPLRRWTAFGIPAGEVVMLSGDGGSGKTTLALQLGLAVATGGTWLGVPVLHGPVFAMLAEDDDDEIGRRLRAIAAAEGVDLRHAASFEYLARNHLPEAVLAASVSGAMKATHLFHRLVAVAERLKPALIVLDPLAEIFVGNELSRQDASAFVRLLSRLALSGAAVLLLAHPSLSGIANGSGLSGSTAWNAAVRARLYLTPDLKDAPERWRLAVMKSNYGPTGKVVELIFSDGRFVAAATSKNRAERAPEVDIIFLRLLAQRNEEGRPVSPSPSRTYAPAVFAKMEEAGDIKAKEFERALDRLLKAGAVRVVQDGPPSKRRSKLIVAASNDPTNAPSNDLPTPSNGVCSPTPSTPRPLERSVGLETQTAPTNRLKGEHGIAFEKTDANVTAHVSTEAPA